MNCFLPPLPSGSRRGCFWKPHRPQQRLLHFLSPYSGTRPTPWPQRFPPRPPPAAPSWRLRPPAPATAPPSRRGFRPPRLPPGAAAAAGACPAGPSAWTPRPPTGVSQAGGECGPPVCCPRLASHISSLLGIQVPPPTLTPSLPLVVSHRRSGACGASSDPYSTWMRYFVRYMRLYGASCAGGWAGGAQGASSGALEDPTPSTRRSFPVS
jgi:hypothetical protein